MNGEMNMRGIRALSAKGVLELISAIFVVGLCVTMLAGCGNKALDDADAKALSAANEQFGAGSGFAGYASNDYVNPSEYSVTSASVTEKKADGSVVSGTVAITLENNSFKSDGTYSFTADADSDGKWTNATFELIDQETTATKGIDFDEAHGVPNADASFDGSSQTCSVNSVKVDSSVSTWYMTSGAEQTLSYAFDGSAWVFQGEDLGQQTTAFSADIEGTYSNDTGKQYHGGTFVLSDLNVEAGTCKVEWTIKYDAASNISGNSGIKENQKRGSASGTESVTFTQKDGKWGFDLSSRGSTEGGTTAQVNIRMTFDDSTAGKLNVSRLYDSATPDSQEQWEFLVAYKLNASTLVGDKHDYVPSSVSK